MSYTTRCPACGTTFKVVPDQLKISDGWVRCGHCADVFDATLYLQALMPPAPEAIAARTDGWRDRSDAVVVDPEPGTEPEPVPDPLPAEAEPAVVERAGAAEDFQTELARFAAQANRPADGVDSAPAADLPATVPPPAFSEPLVDAEADEPQEEVPGFVQQARRQAFWRLPGVRATLLLLTLLLSISLFLQWVVQDRNRIAARHPVLAPWLAQMCEPLRCELSPPRQLDAVAIDSSTLVRRLGSFYAFDVVLKNTADMPVAVPALELSLTDTTDRVMARRVFLPAELPAAPTQLPAHGTVALSLRLSINDVGPVPMAGYRALVFYP